MYWDEIKCFLGFLFGIAVGLVSIVLGILWINITFFDNIPSKVYVDDKLVYQGSSAGFNIHSSGYATTVTVDGGFLYIFPQAVYTSKNVRVERVK